VIVSRFIGVVAVLSAAFLASGCGAAMIARLDATALEKPAEAIVVPGAMRDVVERQLGPPTTTVPLRDGSRLDSYAYTLRNPEWRALKWIFAATTVITIGWTEPFWVPWAALEWKRYTRTASFVYDADDLVVSTGPPPDYGPADEPLGQLSLADIRERCRTENGGDAPPATGRQPYAYNACVVRRMAIWGVE
jgi:hypothetical protein